MTVSREQVIKRVREQGFHFKRQGERVDIYRQAGTKQRIGLPRRDQYEEPLVRAILAQAGLTQPQIEDFLKTAVKN